MCHTGQGFKPDINNGPGENRIVRTFWSSGIYSNQTRLMAPPQAIPILGQKKDTPVQVSPLWSCWCHMWLRAIGLTSIMAQEVTQIVALFWSTDVYLSPTHIMAPSQAVPVLCQMEYTSVHVSYYDFLVSTYLGKDPRRDFRNGPENDLERSRSVSPAFI